MRAGDKDLVKMLLQYGANDKIRSLLLRLPEDYGQVDILSVYSQIKQEAMADPKGALRHGFDAKAKVIEITGIL